jgi:hypothetical protein
VGLRAAIAIAAASTAAAVAAATPSELSPAAPPQALAAASPAAAVRSRAARIRPGRRETVLTVGRLGRFVVSCSARGHAALTFVADRLLPSADVVAGGAGATRARMVHPGRRWTAWRRPARFVAQTWQVAPFAAADVRVFVVHVAVRRAGNSGCASSALALIGPNQGPTG